MSMDFFSDTSRPAPPTPLKQYLEIPLRRPWLVVTVFAAIVTASVVASFVLPKRYLSYTFILVESEKVPGSVLPKTAAGERDDRRLQTIKQEILSRTRLEQVIKDTHPYPDFGGAVSLSDLVETLRSATTVTVRGDDAFSIEYYHADPQKAAEVVNRLATLFIEETNRARAQQVEEAYGFLEAQVQDARKELEAKEESVRRYKEAHMGTLPEQSMANLSTLQRLQLQEQAVGEDLRGALARQSDLEKQLEDLRRGESVAGLEAGPLKEINDLKTQLASLRTRYTDEHPDVQAVLARLKLVEGALPSAGKAGSVESNPVMGAIQLRLEQTKVEVATLQEKRDDVEKAIAVLQARIDATPRTEQEMTTLTRDFGNMKENYLGLLNRKLDAQMAAKLEERWKGERFRVLDPGHVPDRPYYPNRMMLVIVGIALGLVAGLAAAVVAEFLDGSFKNLGEVETALPYPVLATVPYIRPARSRKPRKVRRERDRSVLRL